MADTLILCKDSRDLSRAKDAASKLGAGATYRFVMTSPGWANDIPGGEPNVLTLEQCSAYMTDDITTILNKTREFMRRELPEILVDGAPFGELFVIDDVSLWDIIWPLINEFCFDAIAKYMGIARAIIAKEQPSEIMVFSEESIVTDVFYEAAKSARIKVDARGRKAPLLAIKRRISRFARPIVLWPLLFLNAFKASLRGVNRGEIKRTTTGREYLFLNSSDQQFGSIAPVIEEAMKARSVGVRLIVTRGNNTARQLGAKGIPGYRAGDLMGFGQLPKIINTHIRLKKAWSRIVNKKRDLSVIKYDGSPVWKYIEPYAEQLLFSAFDPAARHLVLSRYIVEKERPDIVVYTDIIELCGRCIIRIAKKYGIPVLRIQFGLVGTRDYLCGGEDNYAVSGDHFRELLLKDLPGDSDRIYVTGLPRYDRLAKSDEEPSAIRCRYNIDPGKKIVLFAATYLRTGDDIEDYRKWRAHSYLVSIYRQLAMLRDSIIIVKPHPNPMDTVKMHENIIREIGAAGRFMIFPKSYDVIELIRMADVLLTYGSTTALEAIILCKPIVLLSLLGMHDPSAYLREGTAIDVSAEEDIVKSVKLVLEDQKVRSRMFENQKRVSVSLLYKNDGNASKRVLDLMHKLCGERRQ